MTDDPLTRLEQAQELNRRILEAIPGGVVSVSAGGAVLTANAEAQRILGLSYDELTHRFVSDFDLVTYHEDGTPCPAEHYPVSACLATGEPQPPMTIGVQRPDGEVTWAIFRALPLPDLEGEGAAAGAVVTFLDVTEERRARQELEASQRMVRAVFDGSRLGLGTATTAGRFLTVNDAFCEMLGYTCEELANLTVFDITVPEDREVTRAVLEGDLGEVEVTSEKRYLHKTGRVFWGRASVSRTRLRDTDDPVLIFTVENIEESRRVRQALQQSQKLESLGVLAGGIAHDFNNLMVGVLGNAGLALSEVDHGSALYDLLTDIETSGVRASELCRQLLAYAGKTSFTVEPVEVSALVRDSRSLLDLSTTRSAPVAYDLAEDLPLVLADATQLRQVVMNLVSNAADACKGGGEVQVRTGLTQWSQASHPACLGARDAPPGPRVFLQVSDTGYGMSEATQRRMFDPFFTTKFTGRGLGLASTMGIVQTHHGTIDVRSAPDQGTEITVYLPPTDARPAAERSRRIGATLQSGGLALVVDDEAVVRTVARKMLQELGFDVALATDGLDALRRYRELAEDVTLALVDVTMPRLGGVETARRLRELQPDLPILMTSGYSEEELTTDFGGTGRDAFIQKPYRYDELRQLIQRLLGR